MGQVGHHCDRALNTINPLILQNFSGGTASVRNVPRCVASGDISSREYHATKTLDYVKMPWVFQGCSCHPNGPWIPHRHYRLVLDVYGRALWTTIPLFRWSLLYETLLLAYATGILHRDISVGNIVIDNGQGWLIDWDMSKPISPDMETETPRRATRTGTWQFMSAALIMQTVHQHGLKDDLESSIYVLLWVALMYSKTSNPIQAAIFLKTVLDQQPLGGVGSFNKAHFLLGRTFLTEVNFLHRPALDELVDELACLFGTRYAKEPTPHDRSLTELLQSRSADDPTLLDIYHSTTAYIYDEDVQITGSRGYNQALRNLSLRGRSSTESRQLSNLVGVHRCLCRLQLRPILELSYKLDGGDASIAAVGLEYSPHFSLSDFFTIHPEPHGLDRHPFVS